MAKRQAVAVGRVLEINLGFEQRVVHTYDSPHSQQIVVQDEVVVADVIILVGVDEHHVELLTSSSQFLPGQEVVKGVFQLVNDIKKAISTVNHELQIA